MEPVKIIPPEGFEIDPDKSTLGEVHFRKIEDKLPKCWEDLGTVNGYYVSTHSSISTSVDTMSCQETNKNVFPTKEDAQAILAMSQLCQLRDAWNKGWKPNWLETSTKYNIFCKENELTAGFSIDTSRPMCFESFVTRDKFFDTFKDLLEIAKPFL